MTEQEQIEKNLSEAFHLMYDGLPEPVQLCHKTYRVVAVNPAGAAFGRSPGQICSQGCPGLKAGLCRQAQMRKAGVTTWRYTEKTESAPRMTTFWIPVAGNPDYYVHFGIGVTIDYVARPTEEQVLTHGIAETKETNTVYQFTVKGRDGEDVSLADYKGKVLLIVNTATRCGFTPQYEGLEWMYDQHKDMGFEILDFPCNQFGQQAPGTDDEIHTFCVLHYKTAFPRFAKVDVNGDNAAPLFRFLTDNTKFEGFSHDDKIAPLLEKMLGEADPDYAKKADIKWNFTKFLIGKDGRIVRRFEPTAPLSDIEAEVEKHCGSLNNLFISIKERKTQMSIAIKPVRFTENGFMAQPFALGGEGAEGLDPAVKYRSCLQNWVIDTGSEVILVDTGLPAEFPEAAADPDAQIYLGTKIKTYLEALADLGYKPEQVSKILITHKHADHTGELRAFPNAQIICSAAEAESDEIKPYNPTVATFSDGPYYEFPASQRIAPGVTYISAPGHTTGNCIVAVETDGLFYLIHGDVTYTDVALYENRLSVVFEDKAAARETLDRVRAFCRARPTVYLGTHTPEALESHAQKRVVDLDNPPAVIPVGEIVFKTPTGKYICSVCGYVYDPAEHDGVAFEDLPADWVCPRCKQPKDKYNRA